MKITTTEAAQRLGLAQSSIRRLILSGELPATKHGRDWLIDEDDVQHLAAEPRPKRGPKPKQEQTDETA
jgi:excisionase family DNA binding protein